MIYLCYIKFIEYALYTEIGKFNSHYIEEINQYCSTYQSSQLLCQRRMWKWRALVFTICVLTFQFKQFKCNIVKCKFRFRRLGPKNLVNQHFHSQQCFFYFNSARTHTIITNLTKPTVTFQNPILNSYNLPRKPLQSSNKMFLTSLVLF